MKKRAPLPVIGAEEVLREETWSPLEALKRPAIALWSRPRQWPISCVAISPMS